MKKYLLTFLAIGSFTLLSNMAFAVIPNFSYTTPNVYPIGSPVTLAPTVTTAAAALTYGTGTGFTGGALGQPWDMDIDNAGNIYVADYSNQRIRKFTGTASVGNFGTGIPNATTSYTPVAIAFDPTNGTPYILDGNNAGGNGKVLKLTTAGAYVSTLITGINTPRGLAVDAAGNLYVTDADATPTVTKYNSAGVVQFTITANLNGPDQIAIDPNNGNIYVANRGGNNILQYNSAGTYIGIFKAGLNGPYSVAVDAIGNVYVANTGASIVNVYNTAGTLLGSRTVSGAVRGLVIDASDDIIVSDIGAGTVTKYAPTGGYHLTTGTLPAGLTFNSSTGTISGTPTAVFPTTNFRVTAYNASGPGQSNIFTIQCVVQAPNLNYATPNPTYIVTGTAITPDNLNNTGGAIVGNYSITSGTLPAGLIFTPSTGQISGTPTTATAGAVAITVSGTNPGGTATTTVNITVNNAPPPILNYANANPTYVVTGTTITPDNLNNTGGAIMGNYSITSGTLPAGLIFTASTGQISGTPTTATAGPVAIVVSGTNSGGTVTTTVNITVNNAPPPILNYADANPTYVVTGAAITPDNLTNTGGAITGNYSITSGTLPAGLIFTASTGQISGTPTTVTAGAVAIVVSGTNSGGTVTTTVNITVNNPPVPAFTYTNPAAITYGGSVSVTPANSGGPSTSCTISPTTGGIVVSATGVVSGTPNAAGTATYTITATNAGGSSTSTVTITVNQKALIITPNNATRIYGAANPTFTFSYNGFITGESAANLSTLPTATTTATATSPVGNYAITGSGAVDNNYSISYVAGNLSVTTAPLTINANVVNKTYGTALITTTGSTAFTSTGLQNGETITVTMTYGTGAAANAIPGTYANQVFPSLAVTTVGGTFLASNYAITYNRANIVVAKANLTITANDITKTYGTQLNNQNNSTAFTSSGLQNGETVGRVNIAYGTGSAAGAAVGTYANQVTASAAAGGTFTASNYNITYAPGDIIVNPANLIITANNQTRDVGINTALTVSYNGFVNGEDNTNLTTQPTVTTTATVTSPPGAYPITASGAVDANYNISYVAGTLTITPAGTHSYTWDWIGNTTTWETPSNWSINGVTQTTSFPGSNSLLDKVQEEVNVTFATAKSPVLNTNITVASIYFGSNNNANLTVNTGITLNNIGDITLQTADNPFGANLTAGLAGGGTLNTATITVINNQTAFSGENATLSSSINALNVSGNISLNENTFIFSAITSRFAVTGGTATVTGVLKSSNNVFVLATATAVYSVTNGTLVLNNATALSGLDNDGTNTLSFNNTGAIVKYAGANQTIYTDANVNSATAGPQYRNLVIAGTGAKTLSATGNLDIAGDFTNSLANNATNYITLTNLNNTVVFNGTSAQVASQTLNGGVGTGTIFGNVAFNGNNTKTMSTGTFTVNNVGTLTMLGTSSTCILNANNLLTLNSDATSTATVAAFTGSKITGNVKVQRFVTGGLNAMFRGYRLFSSPVNANSIINATGGIVDLSYLNNGTGQNAITTAGPGGPANGFTTLNTNPLIYLYDVTRASNNRVFVGGKNVGVTKIAGTALNLSVSLGTDTVTNAVLPVGNSWLLYFVGSTTSTAISGTGRPLPDDATTTAVGTLNQGTVPVKFWTYTGTGSTTIPYSVGHGDATGATGNAGLNQVGNPYPSTIDLTKFLSHNTALIYSTFYELDDRLGTYTAYVSGATSSTRVSQYVVSGQGFLVNAIKANTTGLTFLESDKTAYPANFLSSNTTTPGLVMSMPGSPSVKNSDMIASASLASSQTAVATPPKDTATLIGLHLQLAKDSTADTQTGIYFNKKWTDTYDITHDALDMDGTAPKVYLSSYTTDGKRLCVNGLGDYSKGKRIKLYAYGTTSGIFNISLVDIHNIDTNAYNVFLIDHKLNDSLDMVKYKSYAFNINTSDTTTFGANRFTLVIERHPVPPYMLVNFSGQKVTNGVQLNWKTLNEGTYTGFGLQKLGGSKTYASVYTVQGSGAGLYSYVDQHPVTGSNTYRLQQTDIDGKVTYSAPVTINYNNSSPNGSLTIYPNPSRSIIHVSLNTNGPGLSNYIADIYNISGTIIDHKSVNSNSWTQDISNYKLGVYVIEIKTSNGYLVGQSKFVKVN